MIDRKTFLFSGTLLLAMVATALWRMSLLPNWPHGLALFGWFAAPATLLVQVATEAFVRWVSPPETSRLSLQRWSSRKIVAWSIFTALLHLSVLARSFGLFSLSAMDGTRTMVVLMGVIFMISGNATPKTPLPAVRAKHSLALDPWQATRQLRFTGKLLFGVGAGFAAGGMLLPLAWWQPVFLCLMLAAFAAGIWYHLRLRREPSPLP